MNLLVSWVGLTDVRAARGEDVGVGPIAQAVAGNSFDVVILLDNLTGGAAEEYRRWLAGRTEAPLELKRVELSSPTAYGEIFQGARAVLDSLVEKAGPEALLTLHLSPGTPAMAAVWLILAQMGYRCALIESSREKGVRTVEVPFDLAAEFVPARVAAADAGLAALSSGQPPSAPAFDEIVYRSDVMGQVIARAQKVAPRNIPVLIEGESGTGKELLARAIHAASTRAAGPFVAVNCGAIVEELMESEFFGHKKGSFTGATADRKGHFREADGGTLFLDEIGELPAPMQVKLLRALQDGTVVPVGVSAPVKVDVRIIAATNRNLIEEAGAGRFREDLFYRLAVAVLNLPALRNRPGDLTPLIDHLVGVINDGLSQEVGWVRKKLSAGAKKLVLQHDWPGNIRELMNTLTRAIVWAEGESVTEPEMKSALMQGPGGRSRKDDILGLPVEKGLDIQELIARVVRTYVARALEAAGGNKTKAAELIGLGSYQTLSNWMRKYGIPE